MARKAPPLPEVDVPMFDGSGFMSPVWRIFFVRLLAFVDDRTLLDDFADDVAAAAGGIQIGELYRTASAVKQRVI